MGFGNAGLVRLRWAHLPGNAFKALNEMAWCTLDDAVPPVYYGGPERIAESIGRVVAAEGMSVTDKSAVAQVIRQLIDSQAIERLSFPGPGKHAEYALHLWGGSDARNLHPIRTGAGKVHPSTDAENVHQSAPEEAAGGGTDAGFVHERMQDSCTNGCTIRARTDAGNVHPKEQREATEDSSQEPTSPQVSTSPERDDSNDQSHPHADRIAALRAVARSRRAAPHWPRTPRTVATASR